MPTPAGSVRFTGSRDIEASTEDLITDLIRRIETEPWFESHTLVRLLGILAAEVHTRPLVADRYSAKKSTLTLAYLAGHPDVTRKTLAELQDTVCLEFGCGGLNPLGTLFTLLLAGAKRGIAVDLDEIRSTTCATRALYTVLCAALTKTSQPVIPATPETILERIASFDIEKLANGNPDGVDDERLEYFQKPLHDLGLPDASIDICTSNSVFEHLADPDHILAELARITKPGGLSVHAIDGYDHRYYSNSDVHPLEFLKDKTKEPLVFGCNRIRPLAFGELFERHGFEVRGTQQSEPIEVPPKLRKSFAPAFRKMPIEHLQIARVRYYLRRR